MIDAELQRKFRAAVNGEPNSMFELIKEYLKHPDNPDYVERAYRLLQIANMNGHKAESDCILAKFYWGDYGKKYINFVECYRFLHADSNANEVLLLKSRIVHELNLASRRKDVSEDDDWAKWLRICYLYYKKNYDEAEKLTYRLKDETLWHCAEYLRGYIHEENVKTRTVHDHSLAYTSYQSAAKHGSLKGMLKAAEFSSGEWRFPDGIIRTSNPGLLFEYYLEAAKRGDEFSMKEVAFYLYHGKVEFDNEKEVHVAFEDKPKAFRWLYKAAYSTLHNDGYQILLAHWYLDGKFMTYNYAEAYTWLVAFNNRYSCEDRNHGRLDLTNKINNNLPLNPPKPFLHLGDKYYTRYEQHGCLGPFTSEDLDPYLDYILDAYSRADNLVFDATEDVSRILIELGKHPFETKDASPSIISIPKQEYIPETSDSVDQDLPPDVNIDEIDESFEVVFKEIKSIEKKGFDPSKIRITLIAGKLMDKTDYDLIGFSYGRLNDKKSKSMFQGKIFKIGPRERKLLIALALNSENEVAQRTIIRAVKAAKKGDAISRLNTMLLSVFKGCFREEQSNLIDNDKAELKIKSIIFHDVWNIKDCPDYQECKRIKT